MSKREYKDKDGTLTQREPVIETVYPSTRTCIAPMCAACQLSKAKERSNNSYVKHNKQVGTLKYGTLFPGQMVSMDQCESSVRGRLLHTKGKEIPADLFWTFDGSQTKIKSK